MRPKKYIEKMMSTYVRLFGEQPKEYQSPLEPNNTPELDTSELLELPCIKIFQSMIGAYANGSSSLGGSTLQYTSCL